jgi:hypothetical protein
MNQILISELTRLPKVEGDLSPFQKGGDCIFGKVLYERY